MIESQFGDNISALIIVGRWNNAIFQPEWMSKYVLSDPKLTVEIPLNANASFKVKNGKLSIYSVDGRLRFDPLNGTDEVLFEIERYAKNIADTLPHTPVSSFGINFVFTSQINESIEKVFHFEENETVKNNGYFLTTTEIVRRLNKDNYFLNLKIIRNDNICSFDFNYHFNIKSLVDFKDKFYENIIVDKKKHSIELLHALYDLKM